MRLELDLELGRMSLAQGALDVAIAFAVFVMFRFAWMFRRWIERMKDNREELERRRDEDRARRQAEYERERSAARQRRRRRGKA